MGTDRDEWRRDMANQYSRWLVGNCVPCPFAECGSLVCGEDQKEKHAAWHNSINSDRGTLKDRQTQVEGTFIQTRDAVNAALANLHTDRSAIQTRLATLEGRMTEANAQLTGAITALTDRVAALESRLP